jgi:TPR repeat protein
MHQKDTGVAQSDVEAVRRWQKAAGRENADAQYNLEGTRIVKALAWLKAIWRRCGGTEF